MIASRPAPAPGLTPRSYASATRTSTSSRSWPSPSRDPAIGAAPTASSAIATRTMQNSHRGLAMGVPLLFAGVIIRFPAGLAIYSITTSLWSLGQQIVFWRLSPAIPSGSAAVLAEAEDVLDAYAKAQREVDAIWTDTKQWYGKTIRNTARMGWFSSDRTIRQYADEIWRAG